MGNRNLFLGLIAILIIGVVVLFVDRSNQATSLDAASTANALAEQAGVDMAETLAAQEDSLNISAEERDALATQMAISSTEFESQISELSDAASALENVNQSFVTQVADISGENELLQTQIAGLETNLGNATADVEFLQTQIAETSQASEIVASTLAAENIALLTEVAALQPTATLVPTSTPMPEPTIESTDPDLATLDFIFQLEIVNKGVAQISPDSTSIVVLRDDNVLAFVSAEDGSSERELGDSEISLSDFVFSSDGQMIATIADERTMLGFDASTGQMVFENEQANALTGFALAPDASAIVMGTARGIEIAVFNPSRSQTRQGGTQSLAWSADGTQIASATRSSITLFDIESNLISNTTEWTTDGAQVVQLGFAHDGSHIAGVTTDAQLIVWSIETGEIAWQADIDATTINDMVWSPDSAHLAVVAGGDIRIYSADGTWVAHALLAGTTSVDWSADGSFLAFASPAQVSVVASEDILN